MILSGRILLMIAGNPWEDIDGVRRYANPLQPLALAHNIADSLRAQGAEIILLTPQPAAHSAVQLLAQAEKHMAERPADGILLLASWSSLRAQSIAVSKIKAKSQDAGPLHFAVEGNIDLAAELAARWPHLPMAGFDYKGEYFTRSQAAWLEAVGRTIEAVDASSPTSAQVISFTAGELSGKRVIVTSGPTVEPLNGTGDVLTNFSTGAQGAAIAEAMAEKGAEVIFISGLAGVMPAAHSNIRVVQVWTAEEMLAACRQALPADAFIGVAAVADFKPSTPLAFLSPGERGEIALTPNPDILRFIGHLPPGERPRAVIGFAAENEADRLVEYARAKLQGKNADAICANHVMAAQGDMNEVTLISRDGSEEWGALSKREVGQKLARLVATHTGMTRSV